MSIQILEKPFLTVSIIVLCICKQSAAQDGKERTYVPFEQMQKHQRYLTTVQEKRDSLKFVLKNRLIIGIRYGLFIIPAGLKSANDSITGMDISKKKTQWAVYASYFVSEQWAIALDVSLHQVQRVQEVRNMGYSSASVSGGGGMNYTLLLSGKYLWGRSQQPVKRLQPKTEGVSYIDSEKFISEINTENNKRMRKTRSIWDAGILFPGPTSHRLEK